MTYLIAIALILLAASVDRSDAGCCGCCGCCPCCCCKPIVIKLPPPPTKICPCCCCCKPCCCCCCCKPCCCCCCKPCCCCCCPCCCCGGGGGGRRKRDIVNIAAKKFSDIFLPQQDALNGLMPQQLSCNCQRAGGNGCSGGGAMPPLQQFAPQFQQPSPLCGSTGGCGAFNGGMGGGCGSGFPPLHQLPIIHGGSGGGLNSFHAGNAGFGSNMMNGCGGGGGGVPCADCPNAVSGCGLGCGGGGGGYHDCMMLGDCAQCGGSPNGCLRRLRRRRRRSVFGADASRQRQYRLIDGSGGAEQLNDSEADTHPTNHSSVAPTVASKKRKFSNSFGALKKKPQKQHRRHHERMKTVTLRRKNKRKEVAEAYV